MAPNNSTNPSDYYFDASLTNIAARRKSPLFIIRDVLPPLLVPKQTGKVWKRDPNFADLQLQDDTRSPGAPSKSVYHEKPTSVDFACPDHSLSDLLPDEMAALAETAVAGEIPTVERLLDKTLLIQESNGIAAIASACVNPTTPVVKFDEYYSVATTSTGYDPIVYLLGQYDAIENAIGVPPNSLALDVKLARTLANHPKFQERAKYTMPPGSVTMGVAQMSNLIKVVLGLDNVYISMAATKNTAKKGATASLTRRWGDNALLFYNEPASLSYAGLGVHPTWMGGTDGNAVNGIMVRRARDEERYSNKFMTHYFYTQMVLNAGAGLWLTDLLS